MGGMLRGVRRALLRRSVGFSPASIASWWIKADAITGLANNDPVTTWTASAGNNLTQANVALKPKYKTNIAGTLPAVYFDGTDLMTGAVALNQPITLFMAVWFENVKAGSFKYLLDGSADNQFVFRGDPNASGNGYGIPFMYCNGGAGFWGTNVIPDNQFNVIAAIYNGASSVQYMNGLANGTGNAFTGNMVSMTMGRMAVTNGNYFKGYVGEMFAVQGVVSDSVRQQAENYLINRWGKASRCVGFGNSITAGLVTTFKRQRWLDIVTTTKEWQIVNSGINSTTLQNTVQNTVATIGAATDNNGRDTYTTRITDYTPDYVLILYGLNDLRLNDAAFSVANFQNDLGEIVDGLVASGVVAGNICIGSPPYMTDYAVGAPYNAGSIAKHQQYVAACAAVAAAKSTLYIDVYQWMIDNGGAALLYGDGIHPNDAGHAQIAAAFLSVL